MNDMEKSDLRAALEKAEELADMGIFSSPPPRTQEEQARAEARKAEARWWSSITPEMRAAAARRADALRTPEQDAYSDQASSEAFFQMLDLDQQLYEEIERERASISDMRSFSKKV